MKVNNQHIDPYRALELEPDMEVTIENGPETSYMLLLQGRPINEPVVQYGPFVMNTDQEIQETMMEFRRTQFGGWPWPAPDQVHPREVGRFAKHADGTVEERGI
jgi:hypothetical protein